MPVPRNVWLQNKAQTLTGKAISKRDMLRVVKAPFAAARLSRDLNELFFRHDSISALLVQMGLLLSAIMYFIVKIAGSSETSSLCVFERTQVVTSEMPVSGLWRAL
jgi:hypothetical protein